jgi:hypothetical protein
MPLSFHAVAARLAAAGEDLRDGPDRKFVVLKEGFEETGPASLESLEGRSDFCS